MRTYSSGLKIAAGVTLAFFVWSYGPIWQAVAFAATPKGQGSGVKGQVGRTGVSPVSQQTSSDRFEKALEDIREKVGRADDKAGRGETAAGEIEAIKAKRTEIEKLDIELKKEFAATEMKLKNANLPKEILDRHYKFVKHYEDNFKELNTNLAGIEQGAKSKGFKEAIQRAKLHLEKTKPPKKHVPLDPNKLPHRMVKAKARLPRLKKEEFEKDFPPQKKSAHSSSLIASNHELKATSQELFYSAFRNPQSKIQRKPILVAANGPLTGLLSSNPEPVALPFMGNGFSSGINPAATFNLPLPTVGEGWPVPSEAMPHSGGEEAIPSFDTLSAANYEPRAILLAQATVTPPTADDLSETPEVQFTTEIQALATQLNHNPVKIYEWVRNNIEYQPYYGSFKGAGQTLAEGAGNDFDQASLLIALLRVSQIEARYAYGTVEIPIEKVMNWVGGVNDPKVAGMILSSKGIPAKLLTSGGVIRKIQLEHVWVEARIDYFPSWGARHKTGQGDTWIPLDPSFKQYTYKQGMDMYALMGFNGDQFLQSYITDKQDITAYQDYGMRILDFLDTNYPDAAIEDIFGASEIKQTKSIVKQEFPYLLGTLPYKVNVKAAQFNKVPASKDYQVSIQIEGDPLTMTAGLNYLADKRITVSYDPATSSDEELVAYYAGNIYAVPPYLISVKPILRVGGMVAATGNPIGLGKTQNITISFTGPDGDADRIQNIITAGEYSAIILQTQDTPLETPSKNMAELIDNSVNLNSPNITLDDLLGQMLYTIGLSYFHKISFENDIYAKTLQLVNFRQPSEAMITHSVTVNYIFGIPRVVSEGGISVDVDRNINGAYSTVQDVERIRAFMILTGLSSSAWENRILEAFFDVPSVSAVSLLKQASEKGIPVYTINNTNLNDILPQLQIESDVKSDIINAVNAGKKVIVSKTDILFGRWSGLGYIVIDPTTGAASYLISGGLSGGDCDYLPVSVREKAQFVFDYWKTLWIRNKALKIARAYKGTLYVWGGKITNNAVGLDCSGLVHAAYESMGLPVGNAANQHLQCNISDWLRPLSERLLGDIIWGADYGHVGILAGINSLFWPPGSMNIFTGETVVHASGRPCSETKDTCVPKEQCHGGNPACGKFSMVIESPITISDPSVIGGSFFGSTSDDVCRPR